MDKNSYIVQVYVRLVKAYRNSEGAEGKSLDDVPKSLAPYVELCLQEAENVDVG